MTELFTVIRMAYAAPFSNAVAAAAHAHAEAALRHADGRLAREGRLGLPMRADMIARRGPQAGRSVAIDASMRHQFSVRTVPLPPAVVYIAPFTWDSLQVRVAGLNAGQVGAVLAPWFMHWFDPEDRNPQNGEGLFGVVHCASDPRAEGGAVAFELDLGSAPGSALEDLLERLAGAGARDVRLA